MDISGFFDVDFLAVVQQVFPVHDLNLQITINVKCGKPLTTGSLEGRIRSKSNPIAANDYALPLC